MAFGQKAMTAAATSPTGTLTSRRPSSNTIHTVATDSTMLNDTATANSDRSNGNNPTRKSTAPKANGYPGG
jgi:hypothetical protein